MKNKDICSKCEYGCKEEYEKAQCKEYCDWVKSKESAEEPEAETITESCLGCIHCKRTELFKGNVWFCNPKRQVITEKTRSWLCNNQYYERRV